MIFCGISSKIIFFMIFFSSLPSEDIHLPHMMFFWLTRRHVTKPTFELHMLPKKPNDHAQITLLNPMGVEPKIVGKPPKWMVKIMENLFEMDDLGGFLMIFGLTPRYGI